MQKIGLGLLAVWSLAAVIGCSESGPRPVPVNGTVTMDGAPLAEGMVMFRSVTEGTLDSIPIKDGKFSGKALPGERRVEIGSYDAVVSGAGTQMESTVQVNRVAPEFGDESKLTAKVEPSGKNEYVFEVKSKGK